MRLRLLVPLALVGAAVITLDARGLVGPGREESDVGPLAVVDLRCTPEQIELTSEGPGEDVWASGCGQRARYTWTWHSGWRGTPPGSEGWGERR